MLLNQETNIIPKESYLKGPYNVILGFLFPVCYIGFGLQRLKSQSFSKGR